MESTELLKYIDDFMRRTIASHLKVRRHDLLSSAELQEKVERYLVTVKAIAATPTTNDAIDALMKLGTKPTTRGRLVADVETCYEKLNLEIAGFEHILPMLRRRAEPRVIWDFLRSRVSVGTEFDDEWLQSADAWILRGEVIQVPLGTATFYSL